MPCGWSWLASVEWHCLGFLDRTLGLFASGAKPRDISPIRVWRLVPGFGPATPFRHLLYAPTTLFYMHYRSRCILLWKFFTQDRNHVVFWSSCQSTQLVWRKIALCNYVHYKKTFHCSKAILALHLHSVASCCTMTVLGFNLENVQERYFHMNWEKILHWKLCSGKFKKCTIWLW